MPNEIELLAKKAIEEKVFPGCVVGIARIGERTILPFGTYAYGGEEVREDSVYDLASVTKSIPVASLAHWLFAEEKLGLKDLVRTWIPELQNDRAATIEDLLRYRVRGQQMSQLAMLEPRDITQNIFDTGFAELPGESHYTNLPAFLLGIIIERITGKTLDVLATERYFSPLLMMSTQFCSFPRAVPTEIVDGHVVRGIPHDESARSYAGEGRAVGHAGLFSNAPDLLNFLEAILAKSFPEITRFAQKGLGWSLNTGTFMGRHFGPRTFGKTGFTGTSVVCDCDRGVALVILSNRTYPTRSSSSGAMYAFRAAVADLVLQ